MNKAAKSRLIELTEEKLRRERSRKIFDYYPDEGPLRRELYVKHMEFFEAGASKRERLMLAANRVGKTEGAGGYEMVMHLTGEYPDWWTGRRFDRPITAWAGGDTNKTVRDIIQEKLLGKFHEIGTGLIPGELLEKVTPKTGLPEAVDTIWVKHKSGGISQLVLKSYEQKRISFQGTKIDVIWLDEEPPLEVYTECLLRTMDTSGLGTSDGIIMLTFTPLMGLSETVLQFLPNGEVQENKEGSKYVVMATWDDAPHLTERVKKELWASIPPFQRDARTKGIPQLGSGAIYPVPESDFVVDPFDIPAHWPKAYGMDVGWNRTAAVWGAWDRDTKVLYLYSEHYRGQAEPSIHAESIRSRGEWIPGVIDPASRGRNQKDGKQLLQDYIDQGLDLDIAANGVEAGLLRFWDELSTGRVKVFKNCSNWLTEFRLYRRDENGNVVKKMDHAMDATRYLIMSGRERAKVRPTKTENSGSTGSSGFHSSNGWMG